MDETIYGAKDNPMVGIPYQHVNWKDIQGQPFGLASQFNLFVFGDANNIVDVEGAVAVGGSYYSPRGLSIGFQSTNGQQGIEFSPDLARYLVGNIVSMKGPLVVVGHVISGGGFKAALGSTYYIGKDGSDKQMEELKSLYQANGGSPYWTPSDKGDYYIIPSYDVPRVIPASRISADLPAFFQAARKSIDTFKDCIQKLDSNGKITSNSYEWILSGTNPKQNVFTIDASPNGILNKGIRFEVPQGSLAIVRLKTGPHAHLQSGLYGGKSQAENTLYVFEDATNIHMENSSDIWGSILAPQAMFHGHPTGGHVSGNAVLGGFAVNANSGFEFHLAPFLGNVDCMQSMPKQENESEIISVPLPETPASNQGEISSGISEPCPTCPTCPTCPKPEPCPTCPSCPTCPKPEPCPTCPTCPTCPKPEPCPTCPTCPKPEPCPTCPKPEPCPTCPTCPPCPTCPECPQQKDETEEKAEYVAIPVPVPIPYPVLVRTDPDVSECPICEENKITMGLIEGCILGCDCCRNHEWDIMLYQMSNGKKILISCVTICHLGCFRFKADFYGAYVLVICPLKRTCCFSSCRPRILLKNIGVANLTIE
ncbi:collagen-binding domain-containing protein [Lachnotalea glycerini]|uniref:Choice-of-anchor A family protein n=1 Tax=Lachnotalea glycerini TaxID=1763509 RepID=A0A371JKG4_9FIRM|nr:collagen-binding domain-containing protein [Lachnotalea glycerini]RDY33210.1 choice-of-anchor A family protein [Lachnotalea glycerini]